MFQVACFNASQIHNDSENRSRHIARNKQSVNRPGPNRNTQIEQIIRRLDALVYDNARSFIGTTVLVVVKVDQVSSAI